MTSEVSNITAGGAVAAMSRMPASAPSVQLHRKLHLRSKSQMCLCLISLLFPYRNGRKFSSMQLKIGKTCKRQFPC